MNWIILNDRRQGRHQPWQMQRDMLSPRYTTRYADLLKVR
ncbi:TPA: DUF4113 domain-containing protein [Enterobacter cloacae]|nr:DUF4113 domain-containing protein [Enterobacter pasteurii]